ncbi:MAG TPA: MFS transporter [Candidatus Atribacteria bacterium]|jgi:FHS family glucose/mannose:H+ symporter-like MFS transporter|nr:MFS transporter [Candidatus Atribacteria bacterium]
MTFTKTHFVGYLGFVSLGLANTIIGPAIPSLINEFGMSFSLVGALFFVQGVFYFISVLSSGVASDFFGKKPFLLIGATLMASGLIAFILGRNEISLFFSIALIGTGVGALDGGLNGLFIDISGDQKGIGLGLLHMCFGIGALSGPLIFTFASVSLLNWRLAFLFTACLPILFFLLLFPIHLSKVGKEETMRFSDVTMLLKNRIIIQLLLLLFVYVGAEQVIAGWLPTYLINTRNVSHSIGSFTLSLFFIGLTIGRLLTGLISDKVGYSRTLVLLSLGSAVFFALVFTIQAINPVVIIFILLGFFLSGIYPTVMAQAGSIFPQYSGTISGVLTAAGGIGGMLMPLGMGLVSEYAGLQVGLFVPLISTIIMFFLSVLSFNYLKKRIQG